MCTSQTDTSQPFQSWLRSPSRPYRLRQNIVAELNPSSPLQERADVTTKTMANNQARGGRPTGLIEIVDVCLVLGTASIKWQVPFIQSTPGLSSHRLSHHNFSISSFYIIILHHHSVSSFCIIISPSHQLFNIYFHLSTSLGLAHRHAKTVRRFQERFQ